MRKLSSKLNESFEVEVDKSSQDLLDGIKYDLSLIIGMVKRPGMIDPTFTTTIQRMTGDVKVTSSLGRRAGAGTLMLIFDVNGKVDTQVREYINSYTKKMDVPGIRKVSATIDTQNNFFLTLYFIDSVARLLQSQE